MNGLTYRDLETLRKLHAMRREQLARQQERRERFLRMIGSGCYDR